MTIALFSVPGARWMPGEPQDDQADDPSLTFSLPRRRASRVTSGVADRFHCLSLCDQPRALSHGSRTSSMQAHPCVLVGVAPLRAVRQNNPFSGWFSARWAQYARSRQPGEGLGRDPVPHHPRLALTMQNARQAWESWDGNAASPVCDVSRETSATQRTSATRRQGNWKTHNAPRSVGGLKEHVHQCRAIEKRGRGPLRRTPKNSRPPQTAIRGDRATSIPQLHETPTRIRQRYQLPRPGIADRVSIATPSVAPLAPAHTHSRD